MTELLQATDDYVLHLFKEKLDEIYVYHNYTHTKRVVKSTQEIIDNSNVDAKEEEALLLAAYLHDTGYIHGAEGHEEASAIIAKEYLQKNDIDQHLFG